MARKLLNFSILGILFCLLPVQAFPQKYEVRTVTNDPGYLAVQLRDTIPAGLPLVTTDITDFQFEIRWPQTYGADVDVVLLCSDYNLAEGLGMLKSTGSYNWRVFAADSVPFHPPHDWVVNQWETIGTFRVTKNSGTDSGYFAVAADDWVAQGLNLGLEGLDYTVRVSDSAVNYVYPTLVWDWVWAGGATPSLGYDEQSWTYGLNWRNECGTLYDAVSQPGTGSNCLLPGGLTYYPANFNNFSSGLCLHLRMLNGSSLEIPFDKLLVINGLATFLPGSTIVVDSGGNLHVEAPH